MSFEGFSTAGPDGAYLFHSLSAHGQVLDASVYSPTPGYVVVSVLSRDGDGTAAPDEVGRHMASTVRTLRMELDT